MHKPDTHTAMHHLIGQVRGAFPFQAPDSRLCQLECRGCSKKLLEFLEQQVEDWEARLQAGDKPTLGDIDKLAKLAKKIHGALKKNAVV